MDIHKKLDRLKSRISEMGGLAVAFSGGVDSTFLLKVAHEVLGENVIAVTVHSPMHPEREFADAADFLRRLGVKHRIISLEEKDLSKFASNPPDRCYICKKEIFSSILYTASEHGIKYVADGSNMDDLGDYRPGMRALAELKVVSPLKEAEMTKEDIRFLSREMGLPTWDKPSFACLASRIPYGERITAEKLQMVDKAEQYLQDLGFRQVRVRHHGDVARVEVPENERSRFFSLELMDEIHTEFKRLGFNYTALDLKGYRTGSLNETILNR